MGTDETEIKPALRIVGITQALRRVGVGAEDRGWPDALQKKGYFESVFQIDGQVVRNI